MPKKEATTVTEDTYVAPERNVTGEVTNPRDIEFPFDRYGFTTLVRKEGVRAIGRIKGDETKMTTFISTLRVLAQHASVKMDAQAVDIEQRAAATKSRTEAQYARSLADQEQEVARLEALLTSAKAAVKAKKEMPGE